MDKISELPDTYETSRIIIDGERLEIAIDTGSDTASPSVPQLYNKDGQRLAYWSQSGNNWQWMDSSVTIGNSNTNINEWLVDDKNKKYLRQATINEIKTQTKEVRNRYINSDIYSPYDVAIDTQVQDVEGVEESIVLPEDAENAEKNKVTASAPNRKWIHVDVRDPSGTLNSEKAFSNQKILIYPADHADEDFDFIKIVPIEYVPALGSLGSRNKETFTWQGRNHDVMETFGFTTVKQRYLRVKKVGSTVFLPMTPDIGETNAVDWGGDTMTPIQAAAGNAAMNTIQDLGNAGNLEEMGAALAGGAGDLTGAASAFINNPQTRDFIAAYFAGRAVSANILGRTGIVVNPNLEVLFKGPKLRTFNYNFNFTPRDKNEARTVRRIIKVFKKTMAPKRRDKIFLSVPAVYQIKYIFNSGKDHPFLNKIKPCALSSFNVRYAPQGTYMTYDDGSPTMYSVSMAFQELEPIYNDDINDVDATTTGF